MELLSRAVLILPAVLLAACGIQEHLPDLSAEAARAVEAVHSEWMKAAEAKDATRFASYYAEDAALMLHNAPVLSGTAIRPEIEKIMATSGFSFATELTAIVAARSGDLAYTRGIYTITSNDGTGKLITDTGKYIVVFRKHADGAWRVAEHIFNADPLLNWDPKLIVTP